MFEFLGVAKFMGGAFASMYAEIRNGVQVAVVYYGSYEKNNLREKVFASRAQMRAWVNTSAQFIISSM